MKSLLLALAASATRFNRRTALTLLLSTLPVVGIVALPATGHAEEKSIKVGIISGEDEDVWKVVTAEAASRYRSSPPSSIA